MYGLYFPSIMRLLSFSLLPPVSPLWKAVELSFQLMTRSPAIVDSDVLEMTTTARIGTGLGGQGSLLQFFLIVDAVNVDLWFPEDEHPIIVHSTK